MGKLDEAESAFQAAVARQERLVADYPGVPEYRQFLGHMHANLAATKMALAKKKLTEGGWSLFGRPAAKRPLDLGEAVKLAASDDATGDEVYSAACAFAEAAAHADAPTAERHAARAVATLRLAFARGFHDVPRMLKDTQLDPLRKRADFADLLWDVADAR
jgi:hypothetical protein